MTLSGLHQLESTIKQGEFSILFRNNHFLTITKHNNQLYTLVTDQGYIGTSVCWETLTINGDGELYDGYFHPINSNLDTSNNQDNGNDQWFASNTTVSSIEQSRNNLNSQKKKQCTVQ